MSFLPSMPASYRAAKQFIPNRFALYGIVVSKHTLILT